jgi:predicted nucleic acid-binding protein
MKLVVDTNIVFSAILNSEGKIGQLIILGSPYFTFFSPSLLQQEIENHRNKILSISGFTSIQFEKTYNTIVRRIKFVDEILIPDKEIVKALALTADIDENDTLFVALTNQLRAKLWTGDKKLLNGLLLKRYSRILSTDQLYNIFLVKQSKQNK